MLIDELNHSPITPVQGEQDDMAMALGALNALDKAARYDVNNIWQALHGQSERALQLRTLAGKAPAYPRWNDAWLEHKYDSRHRRGILAQWDQHGMQYNCTVFTEQDPAVDGSSMRLGVFANCFKLYVDENYMDVVPDISSKMSDQGREECNGIIEAVTTVMRVLNWSREVVPITVHDMSHSNEKRSAAGKPLLSSPTVIKFEPMLKMVKVRAKEGGPHEPPLYHPVAGHLRHVSPLHPLFGARPIPGKTCGIIAIKPHFRGEREKGEKNVASYKVTV